MRSARMYRAAVMCGFALALLQTATAQTPTAKPCTAPEFHQFDFWLGEWDVYDTGGTEKQAAASITSLQHGCGLREQYRGVDGSGGESLSMWDTVKGEWQQTWVSNRGQVVVIAGKWDGKAMTLSGTDHTGTVARLVRGVRRPEGGGVRETAERSSDGGKHWQPWFDITFRRAAGSSK